MNKAIASCERPWSYCPHPDLSGMEGQAPGSKYTREIHREDKIEQYAQVLSALVKYPGRRPWELAGLAGVSPSSMEAIINRLTLLRFDLWEDDDSRLYLGGQGGGT